MKIAYNPIDCQPLYDSYKNNDITFDLAGRNIFVKGVKFSGVDDLVTKDYPGWVPIIKDYKQDISDDTYILTSDGNNASWNKLPELFFDKYQISGDYGNDGYKIELSSTLKNDSDVSIPIMIGATKDSAGQFGLVPTPEKGDLRYLGSDGKWSVPSDELVSNIINNDQLYYITGTISKTSNIGTQVFNTNNYINPTEGIYSNKSIVINQKDDQDIEGKKTFINPPIIGNKDLITWDRNGNYILNYDSEQSWDKSFIISKKESENKQFFGWEGSNDTADCAYLGINVSRYSDAQYIFNPTELLINNKKVVTEDTIVSYIDDKYVNVEGDVMTGPLAIKINKLGVILGSLNKGGCIQFGDLDDDTKSQVGYITGYNEKLLQSFTISTENLITEGIINSQGAIYTNGKSRINDSKHGIILDSGTITLNGTTPGINFYYDGSTRVTSSIVEESSGELTINSLTRIIGGSYFGLNDYYFNKDGNIKANDISVDKNLEVKEETTTSKLIVNNDIIYNIQAEQNIEVGSIFVTKVDRKGESNSITKVAIDEFAFELQHLGTISKSIELNVTTDWTNIGTIEDLKEAGTYIVQISDSSKCLYSGVMSWSTKSSSVGEEILLHRSGSSTSNTIYLRTLGNSIQIAGSNNTSSTFTFNFKKVI